MKFGYTATLPRRWPRRCPPLGTAYFGASISRTEGADHSPRATGASEVALFEKLAMRALTNGVQRPTSYTLTRSRACTCSDGKLTAQAIEAITADIDVTVNQTVITGEPYTPPWERSRS